jgi:hypothetical protein
MRQQTRAASPMLPPLSFTVSSCQDHGVRPETGERYWRADVRARRAGVLDRIFPGVVFAEACGEMVFALGMEQSDGVSEGLRAELQADQRAFVMFVHEQTALERQAASALFSGADYRAERRLMLAYMDARGLGHAFGVGYVDAAGGYRLLRLEPPEYCEGQARAPALAKEIREPWTSAGTGAVARTVGTRASR